MIFTTRTDMKERLLGTVHIRIKSFCCWCGIDLGVKVVEASKEMLDIAAQGTMPKSGGICEPCANQLREDAA